ncbi:aminoacyl-tRNA hydrolase [Evansella vedderi]|uniref:aminoacyl-tRNA hydrolase n=1 Tax=Evansella vedderi TaxID=38282 RepID=UPI0027D83280|nr:aminoacyl-tRNA hydrolase [Evansella vedderi]
MKLIVGLGNPGKKYDGTRHNIGFEVIDRCQQQLNINLDQSKFKGIYGFRKIGEEKIFLLKPLTYMNLSGESIVPLMNYYKIKTENLLVIYDDLDLEPGTLRLRQKGGHGGHNGMKSIIGQLGTDQFNRIRVGIGRPPKGVAVPTYVLGSFGKEERQAVDHVVEKAANAVESWTKQSFINVMNEYN